MEWRWLFRLLSVSTLKLSTAHVAASEGQPDNPLRRHETNDVELNDPAFPQFVTRPDIRAPNWKLNIHDESAIAPGHWFIAAYGEAEEASVGPHIYDLKGDLVWSGAPRLNGSKAFDFRVQRVNGKDMLTYVDLQEEVGVILDESYEVHKRVHIGDKAEGTLNIHDFNVVDNGTKALYVKRSMGKASKVESSTVGYNGGECRVIYDGFEEIQLDRKDAQPSFVWSSKDHVGLEETALNDASDCQSGWDYFHANAIDKFPDGDYLLSGRFTNTLHKISAKDGSIVWRLGGAKSDFALDSQTTFSAQGHARVRSQNATHTTVSLMDNAILGSSATNDRSRGLLLNLRTDLSPMTVDVATEYAHPLHQYAVNQGNFQPLPNGNAFLGWRDNALQSEHTSDGELVMQASLLTPLYSYRNFKYPWVGRPNSDPDVVAKYIDMGDGIVNTTVHVSWNGATEVQRWNLYRTTRKHVKGGKWPIVGNVTKTGFETEITVKGFFRYVDVEAIDGEGKVIGHSGVIQSMPADRSTVDGDDHEEGNHDGGDDKEVEEHESAGVDDSMTLALFLAGFVVGTVCLWFLRAVWRRENPSWQLSRSRYKRLGRGGDSDPPLHHLYDSDDVEGKG